MECGYGPVPENVRFLVHTTDTATPEIGRRRRALNCRVGNQNAVNSSPARSLRPARFLTSWREARQARSAKRPLLGKKVLTVSSRPDYFCCIVVVRLFSLPADDRILTRIPRATCFRRSSEARPIPPGQLPDSGLTRVALIPVFLCPFSFRRRRRPPGRSSHPVSRRR